MEITRDYRGRGPVVFIIQDRLLTQLVLERTRERMDYI